MELDCFEVNGNAYLKSVIPSQRLRRCRWRREPTGPREARADDGPREPRRMDGQESLIARVPIAKPASAFADHALRRPSRRAQGRAPQADGDGWRAAGSV